MSFYQLTDQRLAIRELYILRKIKHKNIARLYECIIDESLDKIVFVMEYCDQGQLMIYNIDETGYDYNNKLIIFLLKKFFYHNCENQRNIILDIINFKKDQSKIITEKEILYKFKALDDQIIEDIEAKKFIFDLFDNNFKLKVFFIKLFLKQIIEAVKYLHSKNICNRDIKPENIVFKDTFDHIAEINPENYVGINNIDDFLKITDFSISKNYEDKNQKIISLAGTDFFKAPEILNFECFNPFKAEIYSIGVTIIYFLFKKFYKPKSIKQMSDEEKNKIFEPSINNDNKNEFIEQNSKFITMRSNSFLNRPRKSSIIYNNFEKMLGKEFITDFDDSKIFFEEIDELEFYYFIKRFIHDNPEKRLNLDNYIAQN